MVAVILAGLELDDRCRDWAAGEITEVGLTDKRHAVYVFGGDEVRVRGVRTEVEDEVGADEAF